VTSSREIQMVELRRPKPNEMKFFFSGASENFIQLHRPHHLLQNDTKHKSLESLATDSNEQIFPLNLSCSTKNLDHQHDPSMTSHLHHHSPSMLSPFRDLRLTDAPSSPRRKRLGNPPEKKRENFESPSKKLRAEKLPVKLRLKKLSPFQASRRVVVTSQLRRSEEKNWEKLEDERRHEIWMLRRRKSKDEDLLKRSCSEDNICCQKIVSK